MKKIAVLVSGRGSNMSALHRATKDGRLDAEISLVISNKSKADALDYCKEHGIESKVVKLKDYENRDVYSVAIADEIEKIGADLIVHAGFMLLLTKPYIERFKGKILNIHPALLPSFPGVDAQQQAFDYGVKVSGCSVIFVDEGCDTGPIILQKEVEVKESDTVESLSECILIAEHDTLWRACKLVLEGKTEIVGRKVKIMEQT